MEPESKKEAAPGTPEKSSPDKTIPRLKNPFSAAAASSERINLCDGGFRIGQILHPASWKNGRPPVANPDGGDPTSPSPADPSSAE